MRASSVRNGRIWAGPSAQFSPTERRSGQCWSEAQNAPTVCPVSVRPLSSTMVPESMTGSAFPPARLCRTTAAMAALAFSVSKMVSMSSTSAPPSTSPAICSA